jgi:Uncharacterised protein family (UPF0158)
MSATVLLKDIVDALDMQFDEMRSFLDLETGQVHTVSRDEMRAVEESDEDEEGEEDEDEETKLLKRIVWMDESILELPDKFEVNEWSIMEDFSLSVTSNRIRDDLLTAIAGKGAFRYFKDTIRRHRIEQEWYAFRDEALREIAKDWCEENHVPWR